MSHRTLIAISAPILCTAGGLCLAHFRPEWSAVGTAIAVLGGAGASTVLALAAVSAAAMSRRRAQALPVAANRLEAFADELASHAAVASEKGILLLGSAKASRHQTLFSEGARMLVRAQLPAQMRSELASLAQHQLEKAHRERAVGLAACRTIPVIASAAALAGVLYLTLLIARSEPVGTSVPAAVLLIICGAFAIMLHAARVGERLEAQTLEHELGAELVIEALARLREGDAPDRIRESLGRLLHPERASGRSLRQMRRVA